MQYGRPTNFSNLQFIHAGHLRGLNLLLEVAGFPYYLDGMEHHGCDYDLTLLGFGNLVVNQGDTIPDGRNRAGRDTQLDNDVLSVAGRRGYMGWTPSRLRSRP